MNLCREVDKKSTTNGIKFPWLLAQVLSVLILFRAPVTKKLKNNMKDKQMESC